MKQVWRNFSPARYVVHTAQENSRTVLANNTVEVPWCCVVFGTRYRYCEKIDFPLTITVGGTAKRDYRSVRAIPVP